jgi:uncharacterized protein DUF6262
MRQPERNTTGLVEAAERRSEWARERVRQAIARLERDGQPITFQSVARAAGVSRQFLYAADALRGELERLRAARLESADAVPPAQRASDASLKARNQTLLDENRRLRDEVAGLREELAGAWGELRALQRRGQRTGPARTAS